jgi:hypothetical protein
MGPIRVDRPMRLRSQRSKQEMAGNTLFRDDPAYQAAWTELLRQLRAAGARDAAFWAALGQDVAANVRAREAHAAAWSQAQGHWPTALERYRWWMQEHADLFPTVNAIAVEMALAKLEEKTANASATQGATAPPTVLH